jgi:carboxyl-terminal processing protease
LLIKRLDLFPTHTAIDLPQDWWPHLQTRLIGGNETIVRLPSLLLCLSITFIAPQSPAFSPPDGLNGDGCHNNRKTGDYQCHDGGSRSSSQASTKRSYSAPEGSSGGGGSNLKQDALAIEALVNEQYAYPERLPGGRFQLTEKLRSEAEQVENRRDLVAFAERAVSLLADHHAITGASLKDSWAVFPSYGDLWVERRGTEFVIEAVRENSPAEDSGVRPGDRLEAVEGVPARRAVQAFWSDLGTTGGGERDGYAARVLTAGRRDRPRRLTVQTPGSASRYLSLASLYAVQRADRAPLSTQEQNGTLIIRFNDSLGSSATIPAFDKALSTARPGTRIVLDLRDTASGGHTTVARAILGWFVTKPTFYQVHRLPVEERQTGIPRQWVEQVLPRDRKYHRGPVSGRVGRWTGSMGEGLAVGLAAIGGRVEGTSMAGLLGAIYDHQLPASGIVLKLPTERLYATDGTPREKFVPEAAQVNQR